MDYYAVIGVSRNATDEQIRDAYRRNARRLHPDRNPALDASDRFNELTAAYEVLKDPQRRSEYDSHTGFDGGDVSDFRNTHPHDSTGRRSNAGESVSNDDAINQSDRALLLSGRDAVANLKKASETQPRGSVSESMYEVAAEILEKSFNDFESGLRLPMFNTHKPAVIHAAEEFLRTSEPDNYIAQARSSEHLTNGSLGMVGLSRVARVVGSDASPRAKEAAARSIMFAIAISLMDSGLINEADGISSSELSLATYEAAKFNALAELEAATIAGTPV